MDTTSFAKELLDNYIYHKERLVNEARDERSSRKGLLNAPRLRSMVRPRIEKMASLIQDWGVSAPIVMDAVFAWAIYNRHPDGPMPNMLASAKYITSALSHYLQLPYEVVLDKRCVNLFLERKDFEFSRMSAELDRAGITDLSTATSYPVEMRYLMAVLRFDRDAVFYMAQELLALMGKDRRVRMWMEHRGVKYESVASSFNKRKSKMS